MTQGNGRQIDPSDMAVADARLREAVELGDILESLDAFADSKIKVQLHQVDRAGKPQYIRTLAPPVDIETLADELREEYGGGDFILKVMLNGKFKDNKAFSIAMPKSSARRDLVPIVAPAPKDNMELFLQMSNESRKDQMTMMTTMMTGMIGMMTALAGGRPAAAAGADPAAMIASLASTMKSLQPEPAAVAPPNSMKDMLETLQAMKDLIGEGAGGDDPSFMGLAGKLLPALFDAAKSGALAGGPAPVAALPAAEPGQIYGPAGPREVVPLRDIPDTPGHRVLALIRDDLAYCLKRGHDPETAAELIYGVLQQNGVGLNDLAAVVAEFSAAGDNWPAELGRHGVHLADDAQLEWFNAVTRLVGEFFREDSAPPARAGRPRGNHKNPAGNGGALPAGSA